MGKSKMNKNKIFTSAKKIFKSRDELEQEEVLDIEQQDIAQEIEQLRAEIKAFYLEHPDKDPSMPDKIYVKDMNELEEKITEHIPKKVVEDEIVIKNIIEQDGPSGSNPLDFSRMKEYDLQDEYRSQVFSPDIIEIENKTEQDPIPGQNDKRSDADTIRELFGEDLFQEVGNTADSEEQNIVIDDHENDIIPDINSVKDSLDQDLLKQLQEISMEESQDSELKNRVFTHQDSSKSKSIVGDEESEHMEQEEQEKLVGQMDEETQSMSDLLSRLLSEGKLEADLHNEENQEDNGAVYIPGLDLETTEMNENEEDEDESSEITDTRFQGESDVSNTEEPGEVHDSNLSDLLSNLLSNDQINETEESPETSTEDTEEYRNRVFISSVKAVKNMPPSEAVGDGKVEEQGKEKAGNKPGETVILQEYGENEEEQIEINLSGLAGGEDTQDISKDLDSNSELEESLKTLLQSNNETEGSPAPISVDNGLKQIIVPDSGADGKPNLTTEEESSNNHETKSAMTKSNLDLEDISEESNASEEAKEGTENDYADEMLKVDIDERAGESGNKEEPDSDNNLVNSESFDDETTDQLGVMEDILNSLSGISGSGLDAEKMNPMETASEIGDSEHEEPLKGKSSGNTNNIEDILNSLMEDTQAGHSDFPNIGKHNIENLEQIEEDKDSAEEKKKEESSESVAAGKSLEDGIAAYFQEDLVSDRQNVIHKKKANPVSVIVPEKKKIAGKVTKEEKIKKTAENKVQEERITKERITKEKFTKDQNQKTAQLVKADTSSHTIKVLTEEKRQSLLSRLIQKIRELFKKKPKMEIVSQEAVMEESNVYKSQEKETFINGLITGSVSGDNVTLNPLAVVKKDVTAQGKVLCLSGAAIMGKVSCDSIIVEGTVFGEIEARGKVIIKNDALVLGNIYSSDVRITQGAMVQGDIFFKNPERKGK